MKFTTVILAFILVKVSGDAASDIYNDLDESVSSVKDTIGQLLGGVIIDVQGSIDCTIFAVDQLLASDIAENQRRCGSAVNTVGDSSSTDSEGGEEQILQYDVIKEEVELNSDDVKQNIDSTPNNSDLNVTTMVQLNKSMIELNKTYCNIFNNGNVHTKLESIRSLLKNESKRLVEINHYLQNRLEKIPTKIKDLNYKNNKENSSSLADIWEKLHELSDSQANKSDVKTGHIESVMNEILVILQKNDSITTSENDEEEIKSFINNLADDIHVSTLQNNEMPITDTNNNENNFNTLTLESILNDKIYLDQLTTEAPQNFFENQTDIDLINENDQVNKNDNDFTLNDDTKELSQDDYTPASNMDVITDFLNVFHKESDDVKPIPIVRTVEARKIMDEHKFSEALINKYFNNPNYVVEDGFFLHNDDTIKSLEQNPVIGNDNIYSDYNQ